MNATLYAGRAPPSTGPEDFEYVGFWVRVVASVVDSFLIVLVIAPIGYAIFGSGYFDSPMDFKGPADFVISVALPAAATFLFWFTLQATPGKMLFCRAHRRREHGRRAAQRPVAVALSRLLRVDAVLRPRLPPGRHRPAQAGLARQAREDRRGQAGPRAIEPIDGVG